MTKVIGSQTDVPDVGDPIVSPWYQDTATKIVHRFASMAARDAWSDAPDGARCSVYVVNQYVDFVRRSGTWRCQRYVSSTVSQTLSDGSMNISLPPGLFTQMPVALVSNGDRGARPDAIVSVWYGYMTPATLVVSVVDAAGSPVVNTTMRINYEVSATY